MKNIAIIPARSGSKRLRDKNIKSLCGNPLMAYTIQAAVQSNMFDEVMVSTDSEEYAKIARCFGANVPFLRSDATSGDQASSWDMVKEVLALYREMGRYFESVCLLQPTSPLRTESDIIAAYKVFKKAETAVVSVCEVDHPPLWCNQLPENGSLDGFIQRDLKDGQKAGPFYRLNGAIYIVRTRQLYIDTFLYREGSYAYIMPRAKSIDIDTELDFKLAEFLLRNAEALKGD